MSVLRGELDVGFVDLALDQANISDAERLDVRPALEVRLMLCVSINHALANREIVSARALEGLPFVALARHGSSASYDRLCHLCDTAGFPPVIARKSVV